jgi:LysR family glycine cleavage system transcriptional activator
MRRIPSFFALRAFEAAARLGGFSLACAELHLTPSAISHQIRSLERHFGRPLFVRGNRQVTLTADGERLLAKLSAAFDAMEAACAEFERPAETETLSIHCAPSFAAKWLGPRLPAFLEANPTIRIRLSSGAGPYELLRHEETDLLISYGAPSSSKGVHVDPLGFEDVAALCTPALAARMLDDDGALKELALLESSVSPVRWSEWLELNKVDPALIRISSAFDRGALVISAAVQGLGVALETTRFAEEELASGQLMRLGEGRFESIRREMHFVSYRVSQSKMSKIRTFLGWLAGEGARSSGGAHNVCFSAEM